MAYEASVAIGETRREMGTRFEQTDAAIALKAGQTEVPCSLHAPLQSARAMKITPAGHHGDGGGVREFRP